MVVEDYLSGKSGGIRQIAIKYDIPKEYMVTLWTRKYQANGSDSLGENRGKAKGHRKWCPKKICLIKIKLDIWKQKMLIFVKL